MQYHNCDRSFKVTSGFYHLLSVDKSKVIFSKSLQRNIMVLKDEWLTMTYIDIVMKKFLFRLQTLLAFSVTSASSVHGL